MSRARPLRATAILLLLGLAAAPPAAAQMESREAIALQNEILRLRQEVEQLRRAGAAPAPPARAAPGTSGELVGALLDRVAVLEEEVRRLRGRAEVLENQNRRLREEVEKLQGDIDFRIGQIEGRAGAPRPAAPSPAAGGTPARPAPPPATATGAPAPRTPERALQDGQAALGRRDFAAAEAAAREVIAGRGAAAQQVAAHLLLADALAGRRDFANAAIAYNEAYVRSRTGPRAPEALIGLANSFHALGSRREACDTLNQLRSQFPDLSGPQLQRANDARQRAQCR